MNTRPGLHPLCDRCPRTSGTYFDKEDLVSPIRDDLQAMLDDVLAEQEDRRGLIPAACPTSLN
jgi:hypothetical protein